MKSINTNRGIMTLGDFMDVLGRLHKLTPAQMRAAGFAKNLARGAR